MEVIPVIDVRYGQAVHAVAGDRASYRALETPLAKGADPLDVAAGLRSLYPFRTLYVADLDAIEGRGANTEIQKRLGETWGGDELWIDDGSTGPATTSPRRVPVIGSESLVIPSPRPYGERGNCVLSLDFRAGEFLGPPELLDDASLWPDRVIVMTLARVGTGAGPDFERLDGIIRRAGARQIYAAGGVRNLQDLKALRDAGAAGTLVATALHNGQIKTGDLEEIAG